MSFDPVLIDEAVADAWARLRIRLRDIGLRMPVNDSWIAATAMALRIPIVTQDADYVQLEGSTVSGSDRRAPGPCLPALAQDRHEPAVRDRTGGSGSTDGHRAHDPRMVGGGPGHSPPSWRASGSRGAVCDALGVRVRFIE